MSSNRQGAASLALFLGVVLTGAGVWLTFGPHVLGWYLLLLGGLMLLAGVVGSR